MGEKLVVGPMNAGLRTDVVPFAIDNENFAALINAYQWRGRAKRKRGTTFLTRLSRFVGTTDPITGNLTVVLEPFPLVPGVSTFVVGAEIFVDPGGVEPVTLLTNGPGSGTITYSTGTLVITGAPVNKAVIWITGLPVMGLEELAPIPTQFPGTLAFDTIYSYIISSSSPYNAHDVSFFKNPVVDAVNLPSYVRKTIWTPLNWNGEDYQQFWTINYQGALWATNGVTVPFDTTHIGMQFAPKADISGTKWIDAQTMQFTIANSALVVGDFVFVNEFTAATPANAKTLNWQTGYVIAVAGTPASLTITVKFPFANIANDTYSPGIIQYLTNNSDTTKDCIRWFDGDPTNANVTNPTFVNPTGWVNYMPPLSQDVYSFSGLAPRIYYLVGAKMIIEFKDRLIFLGPVVQASTGLPIYLQDTILYSQNGTPYYTASFDGTMSVDSPDTVFNPILVPVNQGATPTAFFQDSIGFAGSIPLSLAQPIVTSGAYRDTYMLGLTSIQVCLTFTGDDILPFSAFVVNSELGSGSTFSGVIFDQGVFTRGQRGITISNQTGASRIDLLIIDQVFQMLLTNNGNERVTVQRDYINEWLFLSYPSNEFNTDVFNTQTLLYNYRDNSWGIFNETYTTYGSFRKLTGDTWATLDPNLTWASWNTPWNSGSNNLEQPDVLAGTPQGFVVIRDAETDEATSISIQNMSGNTITSPHHCLNDGDYIVISGALGSIASQVNGNIFSVVNPTANTFILNPSISAGPGSYQGGGLITRMYVPFIQTKQFPSSWSLARKTRIGYQQYLFTKTPAGQIQLLIFLSENANLAYNNPADVNNGSLIYSTELFTSPEFIIQSCLFNPLGTIGNGLTFSFSFNYSFLFSLIYPITPGSVFIQVGDVATFTDDGVGGFTATGTGTSAGSSINYTFGLVTIAFTVAPTAQVTTTNYKYNVPDLQNPTAVDQAQIWHRMNTSLIGDTVQIGFTLSDAQMRDTTFSNQFEEIELHGFILDRQPSQNLA